MVEVSGCSEEQSRLISQEAMETCSLEATLPTESGRYGSLSPTSSLSLSLSFLLFLSVNLSFLFLACISLLEVHMLQRMRMDAIS